MNICYIILTHVITDNLTEYIEKIKNEINIPVYVINNPDYKELSEKYPLFKAFKDYVGNSIFPIIEFSKTHDYDKYIVSEWDVRFTGHHQLLVDVANNYDVVLQETPVSCDDWCWDYYTKVPISNKVHCLLNWYSISKTCLEEIEKCYKYGWYGHYECIVPTIMSNNYNVGILTNFVSVIASWTLEGFKHILYEHVCQKGNIDYCLLHPVKY